MWSDPEQYDTDTGERRTLVKRTGVIRGQIVECWIVPEEQKQANVETPEPE